ncbi:MAG: type II secretion system protein [Candidatus Shapirobacteria bacterium]|jgi:type II secretory pathway pseudopilin PulG
MSRCPSSAFTLTEILISIALMMTLTVAVVLNFQGQMVKARDVKRKANLDRIKSALYDRFMDSGCYPKDLPGCDQSFTFNSSNYLTNWPCDPKTRSPYVYRVEDASCSSWFQIYTMLENEEDPDIANSNCDQGCGPACAFNYGVSSTNIRIDEGCYTPSAGSGDCHNDKQIMICHRPGEASQNELCVDDDAYADHMSHGDHIGHCPELVPSPTPTAKPAKK